MSAAASAVSRLAEWFLSALVALALLVSLACGVVSQVRWERRERRLGEERDPP